MSHLFTECDQTERARGLAWLTARDANAPPVPARSSRALSGSYCPRRNTAPAPPGSSPAVAVAPFLRERCERGKAAGDGSCCRG